MVSPHLPYLFGRYLSNSTGDEFTIPIPSTVLTIRTLKLRKISFKFLGHTMRKVNLVNLTAN